MSKEEILKIQTCVLKVNIHCDGCKHKVKKILQKIDGVFTTNIDSELGKVSVSGNIDPNTLINKLAKNGKHAELWGSPKANHNQKNQLTNQFKNIQIDHGKSGNNNKAQKGGNNFQQPKGGQGQSKQQQVQQLPQMKGFQGLKLPQFKGLRMPFKKDQSHKAVKFNLPDDEDDDESDDEYGEFDDDDDDDELDIDEIDDAPHHPLNKMKPNVGSSRGIQMPNMMMSGQHPQLINPHVKGGNNVGIGGGNPKKGGGGGGGGNIPIQIKGMGGNNDGKNGSGGKKGGGGSGNNGGGVGAAAKIGGKNGGGLPSNFKNVNHGVGGQNKINSYNGIGGGGGGGGAANSGKKGGGMNDGFHGMPHMNNGYQNRGVNPSANVAQMSNMTMGQMNQMNNAPMGHGPAVQGLPAMGMNGGGNGNGGGGYFRGAGPEVMAGNPYYQQQMAAMMMNQQRANVNERFQPMMYARPPPAINYVPPYHYQYPPPSDPYTHYFSDENASSSCNVM